MRTSGTFGDAYSRRLYAKCNKVHAVANATDAENHQDAVDQQNSLLQKLDDPGKTNDWMVAGRTEIRAIVAWV